MASVPLTQVGRMLSGAEAAELIRRPNMTAPTLHPDLELVAAPPLQPAASQGRSAVGTGEGEAGAATFQCHGDTGLRT
jgi:hypothetical protein